MCTSSWQVEVVNRLNINQEFLSTTRNYNTDVLDNRQLALSFGYEMVFYGFTDRGDPMVTRFPIWFKKLFRPSHVYYIGDAQFKPILYLHLTKLSEELSIV